MLDFVYYPVSAVLWLWHTGFATVLGDASGLAWVLAIVFLVVTVRVALIRPFLAQVRFSRTMAVLQPQLRELQTRFADDREKLLAESRKLQQQHNFSVLSGCLPILAQMLLFLGLFHVLRSFDRTGAGSSLPFLGSSAPMTAAENAATGNYVFAPGQVQSFLQAKLFAAPLPSTLATSGDSLTAVALVAIPLVLIAAVATHFTARASIARQTETTPQTRVINWMTLWVFPLGTVVAGTVMPLGILVYFATSNTWTYVQQHVVHRRLQAPAVAAQAAPTDRKRE
ncbi:membrane protein insertase YidC [Nocardia wallacei]|uniref:membrane protein insertase YidC n=1 Tax=Nocardia wallacei TaxID=480035 RepID=UPI00245512A3|nr:membrane protein insertase YidC [Nocardia wallacei]